MPAVVVNERLEWHEVQSAIGRNQHPRGAAEELPKRLHDPLVGARACSDLAVIRITQRLAHPDDSWSMSSTAPRSMPIGARCFEIT
jgi:hypothetical protein